MTERPGPSTGEPVDEATGELLSETVERMAHQIKNPLQAVAVNLEVIRSRVRREAPELWEDLERFGRAVDENVGLLDRRLRLLLALGRRGPDDELREAAPSELAGELASALRLDQEAPGVEIEAGDAGASGLAGRLRPGHLLALLVDAWLAAARAGAERTPVTVHRPEGRVGLAFPVPRTAAEAADRWAAMAGAAGGELEAVEEGERTLIRVTFPTA